MIHDTPVDGVLLADSRRLEGGSGHRYCDGARDHENRIWGFVQILYHRTTYVVDKSLPLFKAGHGYIDSPFHLFRSLLLGVRAGVGVHISRADTLLSCPLMGVRPPNFSINRRAAGVMFPAGVLPVSPAGLTVCLSFSLFRFACFSSMRK